MRNLLDSWAAPFGLIAWLGILGAALSQGAAWGQGVPAPQGMPPADTCSLESILSDLSILDRASQPGGGIDRAEAALGRLFDLRNLGSESTEVWLSDFDGARREVEGLRLATPAGRWLVATFAKACQDLGARVVAALVARREGGDENASWEAVGLASEGFLLHYQGRQALIDEAQKRLGSRP